MKTYIVDSFTSEAFRGNPAGVCLAKTELSSEFMAQVAAELGLSETAFVRQSADEFSIRYFSPKMEIPLCGHATLAAARVVTSSQHRNEVRFRTLQGIQLPVNVVNSSLSMRFPVYETHPANVSVAVLSALGLDNVGNSVFNRETRILTLEIDSTEVLRNLQPDFRALVNSAQNLNGVLVTAAADHGESDFHCRYFWPWSGTDEDPVTGGIQTFLAPYWSARLGRSTLRSFQSSVRTGSMTLEVTDNGVTIIGDAVVVFSGELTVPPQ